MTYQEIDAKALANLFIAGAKNLEKNKEVINELNVFPVPDGDTGTNMTMTIMSAAKEVAALEEPVKMEVLCKAMSSGSLRGARGNSGVILSQLFRGFTKVLKAYETLNVPILTESCEKAVETAYKAVMKPMEGTILTVARGMSEKARELCDENPDISIEDYLKQILDHGNYVLDQTPELLPVLKQAGVVDSGGAGLMAVISGAYDFLTGKVTDINLDSDSQDNAGQESEKASETSGNAGNAKSAFTYTYSVNYVVVLTKAFNVKSESDFKTYLESIGDSVFCKHDGEKLEVKVHTDDPGLALQKGLKFGELTEISIQNLKMASKNAESKPDMAAASKQPPKKVGFIAVSAGEGLSEIFKSIGVDHIIEGGQTMNPSTADILDAVELVNAENIFILPNNKNIIMAARQAAELMTEKNLLVIPTKTIPQGITAVINYMENSSVDENEETMLREISKVKTGQITYAVRDTVIDDKEIKKDDYMGVGDKGILANGTILPKVVQDTVQAMVDEDSELISIYYGADITEEDAELMRDCLAKQFGDLDVELQYGGQPIYYYLVSVE